MNKRLKHWLIGLGIVVVLILGGLLGGSLYFYNMTVASGKKSFVSSGTSLEEVRPAVCTKEVVSTGT